MLINIPDLPGEWDAKRFDSVSGAMLNLQSDRIKTAAGDGGAINVWFDDNGRWRGELMRYGVTISECNVRTKHELKAWLKCNFPKVKR